MAMRQKRATADKHFIVIHQLNDFIWLYRESTKKKPQKNKTKRLQFSLCQQKCEWVKCVGWSFLLFVDGMSHDNVEWWQLNKNSSSKDIYNANDTVSKMLWSYTKSPKKTGQQKNRHYSKDRSKTVNSQSLAFNKSHPFHLCMVRFEQVLLCVQNTQNFIIQYQRNYINMYH